MRYTHSDLFSIGFEWLCKWHDQYVPIEFKFNHMDPGDIDRRIAVDYTFIQHFRVGTLCDQSCYSRNMWYTWFLNNMERPFWIILHV